MAQTENQTLDFELVSPEERLVAKKATLVNIPSETGELGILPKHSPLLTTLDLGVVKIYQSDADAKGHFGVLTDEIFVAGGFADVTTKSCSVLAEDAVSVKDIDKEKVYSEIRTLQAELTDAEKDTEKRRLERRIKIQEAKLKALQFSELQSA